jgi:hypothetical protein
MKVSGLKRVYRSVAVAASAVVLAGLAATPASAAPLVVDWCQAGYFCTSLDLAGAGSNEWFPAYRYAGNTCLNLQYNDLTTAVFNDSGRSVELWEHSGCSGRLLTFPPHTYSNDLRINGFDDQASSIKVI